MARGNRPLLRSGGAVAELFYNFARAVSNLFVAFSASLRTLAAERIEKHTPLTLPFSPPARIPIVVSLVSAHVAANVSNLLPMPFLTSLFSSFGGPCLVVSNKII